MTSWDDTGRVGFASAGADAAAGGGRRCGFRRRCRCRRFFFGLGFALGLFFGFRFACFAFFFFVAFFFVAAFVTRRGRSVFAVEPFEFGQRAGLFEFRAVAFLGGGHVRLPDRPGGRSSEAGVFP